MKKIFSFITLFSVLALTSTVRAETMPVPEIEGLVIMNEPLDDGTPLVEEVPLIVSLIPEDILIDEVEDILVEESTLDPYFTILPYDAVTPTQSLTLTAQSNQTFTSPSTFTVTANGTYSFIVIDNQGTGTIYPVTITNIDTTAPIITLGSYNTASTTGPITVTATTNEEEATLNATSHTFTENGSFTFTATDVAGNVATPVTVTITNIRRPSSGGGSIGSYPRPSIVTGSLPTTVGQVLGAEKFKFSKQMFYHDQHEEVTELQKVLMSLGLLKIKNATGYFGPLTVKAVREYQVSHGIRSTGNVGPLTLAELNK